MLTTAQFGKIGNWRTSLEAIRTTPGNGAESLYRYEWAERPVILSEGYHDGNIPESDQFVDGHHFIKDAMNKVDSLFLHEFNDLNHQYLEEDGFRQYLLMRFRDPGVLHHYTFWDLAKDPAAIIFEWHRFHYHNQLCADILQGKNYDIYGRPCLNAAVRGPWERLIALYHALPRQSRREEYGQRLFSEVLAWPLS